MTKTAGWIDGIEYTQHRAGPRYTLLHSLSLQDTILHVCLDGEEYFGIYMGITTAQVADGASGSLDILLSGNKRKSIPARVVSAGGYRHMLLLADSVKLFEVLGSLSEKIADRKRGAGETRLIRGFARS